MKMNIKQQYLLHMLGVEKKGVLSDFEAFATRNNLDFGKSYAVAEMLVWFGNETKDIKLKKITQSKVLEAAGKVKATFEMLDTMGCSCVGPLDSLYPLGLLSLQDNKRHMVFPPFLICKGDVSWLSRVRMALLGKDIMNYEEVKIVQSYVSELKAVDQTMLIVLNAPGSSDLVKICLDGQLIPVLLVAGGMDNYLDDLSNKFMNELLGVLEADGLILTVHYPGTKITEQVQIKTLLYLAGFTRNLMMLNHRYSLYETIVYESAMINGSRILMPEPGATFESDKEAENKRKDIIYLKQDINLCGTLC